MNHTETPDANLAPTSLGSGQSRLTATLITGANGEFGHGLITALHEAGERNIVAIDLREIDPELKSLCSETIAGDILDRNLLARLESQFEIHTIYHLAALLSTRAEFSPELAHAVNVGGTLNLLHLAATQAASHGENVKFLFPSSIAVYGMGNLETKTSAGKIRESQFLDPTTMYGCNKLECEYLGKYYANHYRQLAKDQTSSSGRVDFRAIRFPGVISAFTIPSGGTSDYAPEMIHAAAQNQPYNSFVREDTRIPFITMPDAITALRRLSTANHSELSRTVYHIGAFAPSAEKFATLVREYFHDAQITFNPDKARQAIVDSWPADVDDSAARNDWGHAPAFTLDSAFRDYLIPNIKAHYAK